MIRTSDGNYDVDPNEKISITVTKSLPNCASSMQVSSNVTLTCQVAVFPTCQQCSFIAPATSGQQVTLTMSLDFQSDSNGNFADGDMYTIQFSGGGTNMRPIKIFPPPALAMVFIFRVR